MNIRLVLLWSTAFASLALAHLPGSFSATGDMVTRRAAHPATLLENGKTLIGGGTNGSELLVRAELYDPATRTFTSTTEMLVPRVWHTATRWADGTVLRFNQRPRTGSWKAKEGCGCGSDF